MSTFKVSFTLDESDASYFRGLYRKAKKGAADQAPDQIIREARDVVRRVREEVSALELSVARCRNDYELNHCEQVQLMSPYMKDKCALWQQCTDKDPHSSAFVTRLSAETLADVVNSFIEPISWKSLLVLLGGALAFTVMSNLAFWLARSRAQKVEQLDYQVS